VPYIFGRSVSKANLISIKGAPWLKLLYVFTLLA
jgi:hypothetical protein